LLPKWNGLCRDNTHLELVARISIAKADTHPAEHAPASRLAKFNNPRREKEADMREVSKQTFDPKVFLTKVGPGKTIQEYRKNQVVFAQGEVADSVFYIQKGRVKLTVISEQGKEAVVAILEPGHFFGEGCLNGHPRRIATTTAMEDSVITAITKAAMLAELHNEPKVSELFMTYLLTRNSRIEEDLIDQLFNSSEKRLARLLLLLANFGKEGRPQPILAEISQETLAEMIGTTRSRVSFFMNKFRKLGFISYNGKIEVHNSLLNAVLHDKPQIKSAES
jgi:CRP/FNR family cyclic AMP-dependent transcriptional regulator